jgi:hypothetical protein
MTVSEAAAALLNGRLAVRIAVPGLAALSEHVMALMRTATRHFLALSVSEQNQYMILRPPFVQEKDCDDGWISKRGKSQDPSDLEDWKVYFHCRPKLRDWLAEENLDGAWFHDLMSAASLLRKSAFGKVLDIGRAIDHTLKKPHWVRKQLLAQQDEFVIRTLQYLGPGKEGLLGNRHFDKSFLTAQVGQSEDGLVLIDPEMDEERLIVTLPDTGVFFFGKQAEMFLGNLAPAVRPIEHYIVSAGTSDMRNGIVGFAHVLPAEQVMRIQGKPGY